MVGGVDQAASGGDPTVPTVEGEAAILARFRAAGGRPVVPTTVESSLVTVGDGITLRVIRQRPPAGVAVRRDVLLVHGLSSNALLWEGVSTILAAAGHPVVAIDLRSHGESDAPAAGYDTATAADDVAAVAAALGIASALVAGQSWGGNVVVALAAHHPWVVAGLGLVDGGWFSPSSQFDSWEACERALRPPDVEGRPAAEMEGYLRSAHPDWASWAIEATMASLMVTADGTLRRRLSIPHHMSIVRSMWDNPPQPLFPLVHVPVVLMPALPGDDAAAADRLRRLRESATTLTDATLHPYPGGDHDLHAQQPVAIAADLIELAGRLSAPVEH